MKLACLFLTILAVTSSRRRLDSTAACSDDGDSFYFNVSDPVLDETLSGCYAVESDGAEANGVGVFTLSGDEQADGDMVFFATSSATDDDDSLVWAVGVYADEDDSHSKVCYDGNLQDVADVHPSAVISWYYPAGEYDIEVQSTCNCITLFPSPSPIDPSPNPSISPFTTPASLPTPTPTSLPTPTPAPSAAPIVPTPVPTLTPTQAPTPVSTQVGGSIAEGSDAEGDSKWLDAAWEIVITVIGGGMLAAFAACGSYFWRRSAGQS